MKKYFLLILCLTSPFYAMDDLGHSPLQQAVIARNSQLVTQLLNEGANPNLFDKHGKTPFHYALEKNNYQVISLMLEHGADVTLSTSDGRAPLTLLRIVEHDEFIATIQLLIKHGADIQAHKPARNDRTLLHEAVWYDRYNLTKFLIEQGCNVNAQDKSGLTPLHICSNNSRSKKDFIKLLISSGAFIDAQTNNHNTPLHLSMRTSAIKALVNAGANINIQNKADMTPLDGAIEKDLEKSALILMHAGAKLNKRKRNLMFTKFLSKAIEKNEINIVKKCIATEMDLDVIDYDGHAALHRAVNYNRPAIAQLLIKAGADVNHLNSWDKPPLFFAVENRNYQLVDMLLKAHCLDPKKSLYSAIAHNDPVLVRMLLNASNKNTSFEKLTIRRDTIETLVLAGVSPRSMSPHYLLLYAEPVPSTSKEDERDSSIINRIFRELLNTADTNKDALLMYAAAQGDVERVKELLAQGANPLVQTQHGHTAFDLLNIILEDTNLSPEERYNIEAILGLCNYYLHPRFRLLQEELGVPQDVMNYLRLMITGSTLMYRPKKPILPAPLPSSTPKPSVPAPMAMPVLPSAPIPVPHQAALAQPVVTPQQSSMWAGWDTKLMQLGGVALYLYGAYKFYYLCRSIKIIEFPGHVLTPEQLGNDLETLVYTTEYQHAYLLAHKHKDAYQKLPQEQRTRFEDIIKDKLAIADI